MEMWFEGREVGRERHSSSSFRPMEAMATSWWSAAAEVSLLTSEAVSTGGLLAGSAAVAASCGTAFAGSFDSCARIEVEMPITSINVAADAVKASFFDNALMCLHPGWTEA